MYSTTFNNLSVGDYSLGCFNFETTPPLESGQDDNRYVPHMEAPVSIDTKITTEFIDDGQTAIRTFKTSRHDDKYNGSFQDIKDFMAKPHLITQTTWTTSNSANTVISGTSTTLGSYLSSVTEWANKLQGFNLCRGTAVLKLVLNANPFQAGMLLLHFIPNVTERQTGTEAMFNCSLSTKVQQPSIAIDCRDSAVELRIPYVNAYNWYEIKAQLHDWGTYYVSVLSPLTTGDSTQLTADVSLYLSWENFELAAPLCAQANDVFSSKRLVSDKEQEAVGAGRPISNALRVASKAADAMTGVPEISAFMGPVSWALDVVSQVASFFGFSKPISQTVTTYVVENANRYQATSDGADIAYPTSWRTDNKIKLLEDVTIRKEDEMSFAFLKKVETLCLPGNNTSYSLTWSDSAASNTSLASSPIYVLPTGLYYSSTTTDGAHVTTWHAGNPVYYLSQYFSHWRGSFRLRMKFVKTQFHSGRLQVTWTPGETNLTAPDTSTAVLSLREIIDIRYCDEVILELPYLITSPYLPVFNTDAAGGHSGLLDVRVLNELRAPETVSSSIEILMFWSAGDDFEYNGACTTGRYFPAYMAHSNNILDTVIGDQVIPAPDTCPADECFGEMFFSVKQLLSRYYLVQTTKSLTSFTVQFFPWFTTLLGSTTTGLISPNTGGDPYNNISAMYGFYRGSARVSVASGAAAEITFANLINTTFNGSSVAPYDLSSFTYLINAVSTGSALNNTARVYDNLKNYWAYNIPYLSKTRCSMVQLDNTGTSTAFTSGGAPSTSIQMASITTQWSSLAVSRAFGDDLQLSYFIAAPPLYISNT